MIQKRILIIEDSEEIYTIVNDMFKNDDSYKVVTSNINDKKIHECMKDIPDIILINTVDNIKIYQGIVGSNSAFMTPIIGISPQPNKKYIIETLSKGFNAYVIKPVDKEYIYYIIINFIKLIYTNRMASSLTGLPGNIQIANELQRRILKKEAFYTLYIDLDNFKAYNDTYGFLRGDEVIKLAANILQEAVSQYGIDEDFVGHIGGDDFVVVTKVEDVEKLCKYVVTSFDERILNFINEEDKERGFFEVPNRKGIIEQYPITSISVAGVTIKEDDKVDPLIIAEVGAQIKHKVKAIPGSVYYIGKRLL